MREAADDKRRESDAAIFTFHLERAQVGNDISQRRLAELYQARGDTNAAAAWLRAAITNSPAKPQRPMRPTPARSPRRACRLSKTAPF
jgi:hypothetical protein